MADIAIVWNPATGAGDWARPDQEDAAGGDLVAAVLISLFTDRRASDDYVPVDGTGDRRGVWTDTYDEEPIGSRLWQLERARRNTETLLLAQEYCREALAWLIRDGIASVTDVYCFWAGRVALGIRITVQLVSAPSAVIDLQLPFAVGSR